MTLKRSTIDRSIAQALAEFARQGIRLPAFASWTAQDWASKGPECDEIRDCRLGWEVTDFGTGDFPHFGRTLLTLRNGTRRHPGYPKPYAEKLIFLPEGQRSVPHFHKSKREDIVNRAGGSILLRFLLGPERILGDQPLRVQVDGECGILGPDGMVRLEPGQSVCIEPGIVHQFWAEEGRGVTVGGEVSSVCDDVSDNFFVGESGHFAADIAEDAPARYYLASEYPAAGH
jgi:D-lyxose ketol-isomerase